MSDNPIIIHPMINDNPVLDDQSRDILASSEIRPADEGTRPYRLVMRMLRHNTHTPFVVHMETDPFTTERAYHHGDYCDTMLNAYDRLVDRAARENLRLLDFNHKPVVEPRR